MPPPERRLSGLTIRIDRDSCIGTGACIKTAPEVFRLDDRQIVAFTEEPSEIDRQRLLDACGFCPVDALEAWDEGGERLVP